MFEEIIWYKTKENLILIRFHKPNTLIFSYICWLGLFFGFKILNFNIFWGFRKRIFFGQECGYFVGHHKIGQYLRDHFYAF